VIRDFQASHKSSLSALPGASSLSFFHRLAKFDHGRAPSTMAIEHSENWFLRKHDSGEIFGPVPFEKIREWAHSAQVNPQDMLSVDQAIWTKRR
jgi:hypothetical protein